MSPSVTKMKKKKQQEEAKDVVAPPPPDSTAALALGSSPVGVVPAVEPPKKKKSKKNLASSSQAEDRAGGVMDTDDDGDKKSMVDTSAEEGGEKGRKQKKKRKCSSEGEDSTGLSVGADDDDAGGETPIHRDEAAIAERAPGASSLKADEGNSTRNKKKSKLTDKWGKKLESGGAFEDDQFEDQGEGQSAPSGQEEVDPKKIMVGGMPYFITEDDIHEFFEDCGIIAELDCLTFADTGKFKGIAFITFKTKEAAEKALALDGADMSTIRTDVLRNGVDASPASPGPAPVTTSHPRIRVQRAGNSSSNSLGFHIGGDSQAAFVHRPIPGRGVVQTPPSGTTPVVSQPDMTTPTGGESTSRRRADKLNKNGNWSTVSLQAALRAVDNGSRILTASQKYGIPVSTLRNHLFGLTTSRKRGKPGVLTREEEEEVVSYIKTMASIGHPLTLRQLRLKVAEMTQVRLTPFPNGIPGLSWVKWFRRRHPDLSLLVAQGLETGRARGLCPENVSSFYENLVEAYQEQKYPASQIWNADESGAQAGRTGGAMVVASKGAKQAHSVELDEREHVTVLSCINAEGQSIPNFYIFKGQKFKSNYIRGCESGACMAMQPKGWMTSFLFDKWMSHFVTCVQAMGGNMSPNNRHVLIIDGQNSHVTVDIVLQARAIGLDLITIPAHTSHALQPLDVSCFKPFKTSFRACRDMWSIEHKGVNARKEDLANWVSRGLKKALTPQNIRVGFRATGIWPLDATKMDKKMGPSEEDGPEHEGDEEEEEEDGVGEVPIEEMMLDLMEEASVVGGCHYVVDVDEESNSTRADLQDAGVIGSTQQSQMEGGSAITQFLTLPIVTEPPKRKKNTSEPIIDYSKSIFMTSDAYIAQLEAKLKAIEETEKERARRTEEMERNETKRAAEKLEKEAEKRMRTERREAKKRFDAQWTVTRISEIGDALHKAIRMRYPIPHGAYKGTFCGMAPKICRDNQRIVMERRKLKKQGLHTHDLATVEPTWVYKPNPLTTPVTFVLCSIVPA